jgi:hypothetical protein
MNQKQREYALARVEEILKSKKKQLVERYTTAAVTLGTKERLELIRKGKVPLLEDRINSHGYLPYFFDFSKIEKPAVVNNSAAIAAGEKKLETEANNLKDKIMLGGEEEALAALGSFEKQAI